MGLIAKQWLQGSVERNRRHMPTGVTLKAADMDKSPWAEDNRVVAQIEARRRDGNYLSLYVTQEDLLHLVPTLSRAADVPTKRKIAMDVLCEFNDAELLSLLAEILPSRSSNLV